MEGPLGIVQEQMLKKPQTAWLILIVGFALLCTPPTFAGERVVVIADIHSDFNALVAILQRAGLINDIHRWVGGKATLVQTGDMLDRGADERKVLDLIMRLERDAKKQKGRVLVLLGNHEFMNMTGDLRNINPEVFALYSDKKSEARRQKAFRDYVKFVERQPPTAEGATPLFAPQTEEEWMNRHPPGFLERLPMFGRNGLYGKWLRKHDVVAQVGDGIFLHGGIHPDLTGWSLRKINEKVHAEIKAFDQIRRYLVKERVILPFFTLPETTRAAHAERTRLHALTEKPEGSPVNHWATLTPPQKQRLHYSQVFLEYPKWFIYHKDGPVWFRGYSRWTDEEADNRIHDLLLSLSAKYFVVGHTPALTGEIQVRQNGKVFVVDTGMLTSVYKTGRPSALVIEKGKFTALYLDKQVVLKTTGAPGAETSGNEENDSDEFEGEFHSNTTREAVSSPPRIWLDAKGNRLPFQTDDEILEFLRTARVITTEEIESGITRPWKVLLEKDGVRFHAVHHDVDIAKKIAKVKSGWELDFRDDWRFQIAAYRLARLLGMNQVPPTIRRRIRGNTGSLQAWVENAMSERGRLEQRIPPPDRTLWNQQKAVMFLFDELISNTDRHKNNILIDPNWRIWLIDHTRAFRTNPDIKKLYLVETCERILWENLKALDREEVKAELKGLLRGKEISAIMNRRDKLVAHLETLIRENGEEEVLYTLAMPPRPEDRP